MLEENLRLRANGRNNSQHCCAKNVVSVCTGRYTFESITRSLGKKILTQAKSHIPFTSSQKSIGRPKCYLPRGESGLKRLTFLEIF